MQADGNYSTIKFHLSAAQQIDLLRSRGMIFADEVEAQKSLLNIGYYRFSGYFYPFRATNPIGTPGRQDQFQPQTSFEIVEKLCEFDRQMRLLVLDAIAIVEVAVRCDIAHRLGLKHRLAHEQPSLLDQKFCVEVVDPNIGLTRYDEWRSKLDTALHRARKEDFVKHHHQKYAGRLPIWVVVELWDFGLLSHFFAGMQYKDQSFIAKRYGLHGGQYLQSWLRTLNFIRNVAAHNSRLWNRNIVEQFKLHPMQAHHHLFHLVSDTRAQTRLYGSLCILQYLVRSIVPTYDWKKRLKDLCATFPQNNVVSLSDAGFPLTWETAPMWR